MVSSWITLGYILFRFTFDLLQIKAKEKLNFWKILLAFGIFLTMAFLVFLEVYVITDLLARQFSDLFSISFAVLVFIFGYEISDILFDNFYGEYRVGIKKLLSLKTFLHYFYNSFFGLIFLIIASFILLFF